MKVLVLLLSVVSACVPHTRAETSHTVLPPERSSVVVRKTPAEIAPAITNMFAARGFLLVEQIRNQRGGLALHIRGRRTLISTERWMGSAFAVFIDPRGDAAADVAIVGRPLLDGAELCAVAPDGKERCGEVHQELAASTDGRAEAEVILGVLDELRVHGVVDDTAVAEGWIAEIRKVRRERCIEVRTRLLKEARAEENLYERRDAYQRAGSIVCD